MAATRYTLRFLPGVTFVSAFYGSAQYGSGTYGQLASDPLPSLVYQVMPWPAGLPDQPAWLYRRGDTLEPFGCQVRSIDLGPLDLAPVVTAELYLTPMNPEGVERHYPLTKLDSPRGRLGRNWVAGDLTEVGAFRSVIVLTFISGRRLSLPFSGHDLFSVHDALSPTAVVRL